MCRGGASAGADGLGYLATAEARLAPPPPRLVAVGGLQGTGKTRLARALAPDARRGPRRAGPALATRSASARPASRPKSPLPAAAYTAAASAAVFAELAATAAAVLRAGHAVVADAVFLRPAERAAIAAAGAPFTGFWLQAPLAVLETRIAARRGDASDADAAVLAAAAARDPGPIAWTVLDAAADPVPAAREALGLQTAEPC